MQRWFAWQMTTAAVGGGCSKPNKRHLPSGKHALPQYSHAKHNYQQAQRPEAGLARLGRRDADSHGSQQENDHLCRLQYAATDYMQGHGPYLITRSGKLCTATEVPQGQCRASDQITDR